MPKLNRDLIRGWLARHNWTMERLAEECSVIGEDYLTEGVIRNAVNGHDPMRQGRIHLISQVTQKYSDGIPYEQLVAEDGDGR